MAGVTARELGEWFDRHAAGLVLYARQWTGKETAEDVVQEVFVKLAAQGEAPRNVRAWLMRSVRNAALDAIKTGRRRQLREERAGESKWFEGNAQETIETQELQAAMKRLSEQDREIVILRIWNGATLEETAEVMGMAVSTVYARHREALRKLKLMLQQANELSGR